MTNNNNNNNTSNDLTIHTTIAPSHLPIPINNDTAAVVSPHWQYLRGILTGTASGITKLVVGHPFDSIKVRMQVDGATGRFAGPLDCFKQTIRLEGFRGLYKGYQPPLLGWSIIDSLMWGSLVQYRRLFQEYNQRNNSNSNNSSNSNNNNNSNNSLSMFQHLLCGTAAGWTSVIVVTPIEQVKARLQVQYADPSTKIYTGPIDCIRKLVRNNGLIKGLYHGAAGTALFRSFMGLYFCAYELFSRTFTKLANNNNNNNNNNTVITAASSSSAASSELNLVTINFLSGGCAATVLWTIAFPTDLIKNKMMAQPDVSPRKYPTVTSCIKSIYRTEGIKGFYRGFIPCMLRSFPTNGAAFVAAEMMLRVLPGGKK